VPLDDETWLVLHEVRLRGVATVDGPVVTHLEAAGLVVRATRGVRVTASGRTEHEQWARLAPGSDDEARARRAYERFLPLNRELIRVCNDWQVRPGGAANDHRDARYDWSVLDRLHGVDERIGPIVSHLARLHPRFARYRSRLRDALAHADDGGTEWVTSPRIDSYHTVWMQLHEDLLLAIGADRAEEGDTAR